MNIKIFEDTDGTTDVTLFRPYMYMYVWVYVCMYVYITQSTTHITHNRAIKSQMKQKK